MILDAVEYHESVLPDGETWQAAAALLAALVLWAKRNDFLARTGEERLRSGQIDRIGSADSRPSDWVASEIDFTLTDSLFSASVVDFVRELVSSGVYYRLVSEHLGRDAPYGLTDEWSALEPVANLVQERFLRQGQTS
jgi:hypothetical protein